MNKSSDVLMTGPAAPAGNPAHPPDRDARLTTLALQRGQGVAAWRQIADEIEEDIRAGRLASGAQLPIESQLAQRFAVNRHTVRRALAVLAQKGLVRTTQGRGTFVEAKPIPYPIAARTRFSEIVSRDGHEAGGELLAAEELAAPDAVAAALGIAPGSAVLRIRMRRFVDGTPIVTGVSHFPLPRFRKLAKVCRKTGSVTRALEACGVADYRRLETRITARPASAEEARLLDLAPGRVVLAVESINVDAEGARIQMTQSAFAADRVELRFDT